MHKTHKNNASPQNVFAVILAMTVGILPMDAHAADMAVIVRDGMPRAVIVVPDKSGRAEPFAAAELQKYIEKISGARLDILTESTLDTTIPPAPDIVRIFIGRTRASTPALDALKNRDVDAFMVKVAQAAARHDLFLAGVDDRGTVYAVYDFLERELGCRWLAPGELWEEIPRAQTISAPVKTRIEEPVLKYRQDNSLDGSDWGMKQKANICRRIFWPFDWMDDRYREVAPLPFELRGWEAVHDAPRIVWGVDRDNPEWFALNAKDERWVGGAADRHKGQICFSNPEVHDLLAERLSQLFRERPELGFVEVGCADGLTVNYCHCPRCMEWDALGSPDRMGGKRGGQTHRWLALVNAVANRLAESDPGKNLVAAAYSSYQEPPDPAVIKPSDNVIIMYWTWSGCRLHGYEHENEWHANLRGWMEAWRQITPAGMIMSEYVSRSAMDGMMGTNPRRFVNDMRWLHAHGFVGYNAFDGPIPWGMQIINRYAILKAMWNPELDVDELIRDFCEHAFHAAAADMQSFIKAVQAAMDIAPCDASYATSWVTPEAIAVARAHLNAAHAVAAGDPVVQARLRQYEWHFHYTELAGTAYNLWLKTLRTYKDNPDPAPLREAIRLGEAALNYQQEMQKEFPDEPFRTGWRLRDHAGKNGDWHALLRQVEKLAEKRKKP